MTLPKTEPAGTRRPRIAVSACLLGHAVRYDGKDKKNGCLCGTIGRFAEWVPLCPEAESGFGIPRPPVDLVQINETIRVIRHGDEKDCTPRLDRWCRTKIRELAALRPDALIVKSRSPSCALASASVLDGRGTVISRSGTGIFTRRFLERFHRIPVTEPDRLESPEGRETFWDRVFVFRDFRNTFRRAADRKKILDFHEAYRPVFDMRGGRAMRVLDRVAERCATAVSKNGVAVYGGEIARLLERPATPANRVRVCRGLLSRIGSFTAPDELKLARELIEAMRRETVSSRVVFGVLAHLLRNRTEEVSKFRALAERWGFAGSG